MPGPDPAIDTARRPSLSFAPTGDPKPDPQRPDQRHGGVTPARVGRLTPQRASQAGDKVNAFPVQAAKVQPPPLRDDILARDRLLDWLHAKIHQRLVLVLAEAGYGKTTLLADFAARTRLRTLWYRLDEDDRDWVTVMHHLVAAGREHDPNFAPRTAGLLADTGVAGPTRAGVTSTCRWPGAVGRAWGPRWARTIGIAAERCQWRGLVRAWRHGDVRGSTGR